MRRDPVELEIFKNLYHSIAEEMGAALRRTAFSPNIKERRDYSCAVFDGDGEVIAMGDHMPVHLGSMPMSVQAAIAAGEMNPGDMVMLNDPFRGGTHLPDITLVAPVYVEMPGVVKRGRGRPRHTCPDFYVASRAHHADVGGTYPGSMGLCREIYQEGLRIPPVKIDAGGSDGSRCAGAAAEQRAHPRGTRRRPGRADRRLPHRSGTVAGSLRALRGGAGQTRRRGVAGIFRRTDAGVP